MKNLIKITLLAGASLIATACSEPQWHSGIDEYAVRMGRVLDLPAEPLSWSVQPSSYPKPKELRWSFEPASIGLIDFLRLSRCGLQRLVGARNSSLGLMQKDSTALFYHVRFVALADECLRANLVPQDLIQPLQAVAEQKRRELPRHMWNAAFASQEFASLMSSYGGESPSDNSQIPASIEEALSRLGVIHKKMAGLVISARGRQQPKDEWVDIQRDYEQALQVLSSTNYIGVLLHQRKQISSAMNQLRAKFTSQAFCSVGKNGQVLMASDKKNALKYVFSTYYIDQLQRRAAYISQQYEEWEVVLNSLLLAVEAPDVFLRYLGGLQAERVEFDSELAWQTKFWQERLAECGMSPGQ